MPRLSLPGRSAALFSAFAILTSLGTVPLPATAQTAGSGATPNAALEQRRQQERLDALRRQQEKGTDVRRPAAPAAELTRLPEQEAPCFNIDRLQLTGDDEGRFGWLLKAANGPDATDSPQGRCLGSQGINLVSRRLQNALIAEGYVTSRVTAEAQDLKAGTLTLRLFLGRIHAIRFAGEEEAPTSLRTAVPAKPGDVLNLRDVEQALENFKRLPSADADIRIEPAATQGESDLVIAYRRTRPWRLTLAGDDSGTRATGKYQGNVTVAYEIGRAHV